MGKFRPCAQCIELQELKVSERFILGENEILTQILL